MFFEYLIDLLASGKLKEKNVTLRLNYPSKNTHLFSIFSFPRSKAVDLGAILLFLNKIFCTNCVL